MVSKKVVLIIGVIVLITVNFIILSITSQSNQDVTGIEPLALPLIAPFQRAVTRCFDYARGVWDHYFFLINVSTENALLKAELRRAVEQNHHMQEVVLANARLRKLLNFKKGIDHPIVCAEVVGRDPSPWFKTVVVDKGREDGVAKGFPVAIPEGIVGQVMSVADHYAKVLLIIDPNSAVDALVQRNRARGIVEGGGADLFHLKYVLRKYDVRIGDSIVSSGLDGVFPKGIHIGHVSTVIKGDSGIFQEIKVTPSVDFEKLEEVIILLNHDDAIVKKG